MTMDLTVRALDADGALLLDLNAGPYRAVILPETSLTWRRITVTSPYVDGTHETQAVADGVILDVQIRVRGATWQAVESARAALVDAVTAAPTWQLQQVKQGVGEVWRCDRPDINSPTPSYDVGLLQRVVALRVPAQPIPAMTGV